MCLQDCLLSGCRELGAVVQLPNLVATGHAFAIWCCGGRAITWGRPDFGGDCAAVQDQLRNVFMIQASQVAFAAITSDGRVVTWGHPVCGGDSTTVQDQLRNVSQIQASIGAFAAITSDGRVVTWGHANFGGDSTAVQDQLQNVSQIQACHVGFAAITLDGRVVTWGDPYRGGDSTAVQDQLRNVCQIQASDGAFAAITSNGRVVTWGHRNQGGDSTAVQDQLRNVSQIQASYAAFAAITLNGGVVTWGDPYRGGDSTAVQDQLRNVCQIQASDGAFAAISDSLPTTSKSSSRAWCGSTMANCWQGKKVRTSGPWGWLLVMLMWFCTLSTVQANDLTNEFAFACGLSHCSSMPIVNFSCETELLDALVRVDDGLVDCGFAPSSCASFAFSFALLIGWLLIRIPSSDWFEPHVVCLKLVRWFTFCLLCFVSSLEPRAAYSCDADDMHKLRPPDVFAKEQCAKGASQRHASVIGQLSRWFSKRWCPSTRTCMRKPLAARRAGHTRVKGPRRHWKHWWHKRFKSNPDKPATTSACLLRERWMQMKLYFVHFAGCLLTVIFDCFFALLHALSWITVRPVFAILTCGFRFGSASTAKATMLKPHPRQGLNLTLRGGGGKGGSNATARKREENREQELLAALASVVASFSQKQQQPQSKFSKPKQHKTATPPVVIQQEIETDSSEKGLLQALERIIARAQRQPGTLLQRLTTLVHTASQGHGMKKKEKNKRKTQQAQSGNDSFESSKKRGKHAPAPHLQPKTLPHSVEKATSYRSEKSNFPSLPKSQMPSWADVARGKPPEKSKPKGKKSVGKPVQHDSPKHAWKLLDSAWPKDALVSFSSVHECLENGQPPKGRACVCTTWGQVEDLMRLAKLHQLQDQAFAVLLPQGNDASEGKKVSYLPTFEAGRPAIRPFFVYALVTTLPDMPTQKVHHCFS